MSTITTLTLYPIKSCAGISLQAATITTAGLSHQEVHDREWMVVDRAGQFLSQRSHPVMALIVPALQADVMTLQAPGMPSLEISTAPLVQAQATSMNVTVWDSSLSAHDCGDAAAAWFSQVVGQPSRLVRFDPEARRLASKKWTLDVDAPTRFADGYPVLLISQGSLDDLNQKLQAQGRAALPMNRFRPNIVIDGVDAFEEDFAAFIQAGPVRLQPVKPCTRCPMPAIDQATGKFGPDPMDIMLTYRGNPRVDGAVTFGVNAVLLEGAGEILRTGQEIEIELDF
ncbi:Flavodoxin reductases (ferredoxin-NADPH reductases) family 1 [Collimonas arenae]|uniref:Flavodoxin reductases (Ferredoxin-NADPH reductases) family 1 n=1 Tax=Collimonas arenae TaxID=279058 RepID=A0A0A1F535_9BURK|nr:MOSC N-terminal beta barrel domain-containing protein [Collimonas arenae]AIY39808.1 Flavodoxin reductases (ferredoxin-NADPH reductases) family 1 [Collimonas arenae]